MAHKTILLTKSCKMSAFVQKGCRINGAKFCTREPLIDWECGEENAYSGRITSLNTVFFRKWK
jgi:hypothetical protein